MAIGKGRKGITEEEYETGINFLKKYMRTYIRGLSPATSRSKLADNDFQER